MALIYLNNFPREDAVKGEKFVGDDKLEAELLKRGIIGNGDATVESSNYAKQIEVMKQKVSSFDAEKEELLEKIEVLDGLVQEAITLPKGQVPAGYEKDES